MTKKTLIISLIIFGFSFTALITVLLIWRDPISKYTAIVSSISAFLYLTFNSIVVVMNINSLNMAQRPYLIVAFETFEKGKGQFTLRNLGSVAAIVKSIKIGSAWLEEYFEHTPELTEAEKKFLRELKRTHIIVSPQSRVVLKPTIEPQKIIDGQYPNEVVLTVSYTNIQNKKFEKKVLFDFSQYNEMIDYQSDSEKSLGSAIGNSLQ